MQKVKVLIVEDEMLVAKDLEYQLSVLDYDVCAVAKSGQEALRACEIYQPDIILMDIKIKGEIDGVDTAIKISNAYNSPIIFLSDVKDREIVERAKKTKSHAFLEKPVTEFNLNTTIEFAIEKHFVKKDPKFDPDDPLCEALFVRDEGRLKKIPSEDILWIKADGAYCEIKTPDWITVQSKNMREVSEHLNPKFFIKVHRSYTINATKIDDIEGSEVSIQGERIPIGKTYLQSFKERLNIV